MTRQRKQQLIYYPRLVLCLLLEDLLQVIPHDGRRLCGVETVPQALLAVVLYDGSSLLVVRRQALGERVDVVVRTLDEGFAGDVVREGLLRRAVWNVSHVRFRVNKEWTARSRVDGGRM